MSTTFESLISTLDQLNVRHFPDASNNATLLPYRTPNGDLLVVVRVECDGEYIALHTQMPSECPDDARLGRLIAEQNFGVRLVQLGARNGIVSASTGVWLMDTKATPKMLGRYLDNFVSVASRAFAEIRNAASGKGSFSTALTEPAKAA